MKEKLETLETEYFLKLFLSFFLRFFFVFFLFFLFFFFINLIPPGFSFFLKRKGFTSTLVYLAWNSIILSITEIVPIRLQNTHTLCTTQNVLFLRTKQNSFVPYRSSPFGKLTKKLYIVFVQEKKLRTFSYEYKYILLGCCILFWQLNILSFLLFFLFWLISVRRAHIFIYIFQNRIAL